METAKGDPPKLPDMIMCGDHPSYTKTELNAKEDGIVSDKTKEKPPMSYARISPTASRTEEVSSHALRSGPLEARRRARDTDPRNDDVAGNRAMVQAALGSFRWPPYLVGVWVAVLLLTHALHCLAAVLDKSLPTIKKCCQYFRGWTEEAWKEDGGGPQQRVLPPGLACATGLLYALYYALCALHAATLWAVEPPSPPPLADDDRRDVETKLTNYLDEVNSRTYTANN